MDTKNRVAQVVQMVKSLKSVIHHDMAGPRLLVVHTTTEGPVRVTLKFWSAPKTGVYTLVFSTEFDASATETQVVDAMKLTTKFLNQAPTFTKEETHDIIKFLREELAA